ncbi:hypothetical protein [Aeromonas caviae]|uniref:hypothetical protein n=1 Tax=Aeromonas caviae TaxID=648 RepID=UPI002E22D389
MTYFKVSLSTCNWDSANEKGRLIGQPCLLALSIHRACQSNEFRGKKMCLVLATIRGRYPVGQPGFSLVPHLTHFFQLFFITMTRGPDGPRGMQ